MRPLEPAKKRRPRTKNILDRVKERCLRNHDDQMDLEGDDTGHPEQAMLDRIQEVKLAREHALRDAEDGDSDITSLGNSHANSRVNSLKDGDIRRPSSVSRKSSTVPGNLPQIIIESEAADLQEDVSEKSKMLREDDANENNVSKSNGALPSLRPSALPRHILGEVQKMNGHIPQRTDLSNESYKGQDKAFLLANTDEPIQNGLLLSVNGEETKKKSSSTANVWGLHPVRKRRVPPGVDKEDYARPLYRRDIFYSGSILHIHEFRSQPDFKQYVASITTIPNEISPDKEGRIWKTIPLPKAAKDILRQMLDPSLLRDPVFLIACLGEIFGFVGLFVPFVFVAERAIHLGVSDTNAAFLLSVIGKC